MKIKNAGLYYFDENKNKVYINNIKPWNAAIQEFILRSFRFIIDIPQYNNSLSSQTKHDNEWIITYPKFLHNTTTENCNNNFSITISTTSDTNITQNITNPFYHTITLLTDKSPSVEPMKVSAYTRKNIL